MCRIAPGDVMARMQLPLVLVAWTVCRIAIAGPTDTAGGAPQPPPTPPTPPPAERAPADPASNAAPDEFQAETARSLIKRDNCRAHTASLATALSAGGARLTDQERVDGYVLLQRCARQNKAWRSLIAASNYLLDHAPAKANAEDAIAGYLALGDELHAAGLLQSLAKSFPQQRANLTIAASMIACHKQDLQRCFTASGQMLALLAKDPAATRKAVGENMMFHAVSAAALGKYEIYDAEMKQLETAWAERRSPDQREALDRVKLIVDQARAAKLFVDLDHADALAIGTYHLIAGGKIKNTLDNANALITLRMVNQERKLRTVTVSVEVTGITDVVTETIALPPGKQVDRLISPPLKIDFKVAKLRSARVGQITLHIVDQATHAPVLDRTLLIQVLPRDNLPLSRKTGEDDIRPTYNYAAAWVTPNAPAIDAFLAKAKARLPGGASFSGKQSATRPQVKALFEELRAHGVSYVMDPALFDERGLIQRTRLPSEVLASSNAQCLEGTLLYATLLESIGIAPVLVFIPGHAFLAWKPSRGDATREPLLFLETTMTGGTRSFEEAMDSARSKFVRAADNKQFARGTAAMVDIVALRARGYTPQPY